MELLVVIAVIAALASLLFAAVGRAKNAARSAKCKSNLRQLGLALRLYVDDFQTYPSGRITFPDLSRVDWIDFLTPYVSILRPPNNNTVLTCPAFVLDLARSGYGYNLQGYAGMGLGPDKYQARQNPLFIKESEVASPSQMIALGDSLSRAGTYVKNVSIILERATQNYDRKDGPSAQRSSEQRHTARINISSCDGHIESMTLKKAFFDESDEVLAIWNRDHEPHRAEWEQAMKW